MRSAEGLLPHRHGTWARRQDAPPRESRGRRPRREKWAQSLWLAERQGFGPPLPPENELAGLRSTASNESSRIQRDRKEHRAPQVYTRQAANNNLTAVAQALRGEVQRLDFPVTQIPPTVTTCRVRAHRHATCFNLCTERYRCKMFRAHAVV